MCGRFSLKLQPNELAELFSLKVPEKISTSWPPSDIFTPGSAILGITSDQTGNRRLSYYRWGFTPSWIGNKNISGLIFNTRSETIQSKSSFRPAFFSRRALIPADGFFEWGYVMDPSLIDEISEEVMFDFGYKAPKKRSKSRGRAKKAFLISRNDGMTFALAAIFDITYIPDDTSGNRTELSLKNYAEPRPERGGQFLYSCSIITTEANADIAHIHHRQPVIIEKGDWQDWLSPNSSPQELAKLLECSPIGTLGSDPFPTGS